MHQLIHYLKRFWNFLWHDDSIWSWLLNIVVAFLVIRFIVYPVLGVLLGTGFPIVAVVSESMEHGLHHGVLCGRSVPDFKDSVDNYWDICGKWYEERGIGKDAFLQFPFPHGFDKGDVIILWRAHEKNLNVGDILVFQGSRPQPIIHRLVDKRKDADGYWYQTKGDHNMESIEGDYGETNISPERIYGKGIVRIPYLGWVKILFVDALRPLGIVIER